MDKFANRLKWYMETNSLRQTDIIIRCKHLSDERGVKLNRSDLSQYLNGSVMPGSAKLNLIADALGINSAWLEGHDVPMVDLNIKRSPKERQWIEKKLMTLVNISTNPRLVNAIDVFFDLPRDDFYKVIEYIELLGSKHSQTKSDQSAEEE